MAAIVILKYSDELLLDILSYFDPLSRELHSTALTCRRLYRIALPILYREIRFDCKSLMGKDRFDLETFIQTLDTHQERAAWVQSARFSLYEDETRMWSDITDLCSTLHSIHIVNLRIAAPHSDWPRRECDPCLSKFICKWPHLRKVHVEDPRISVDDILSFGCLPNLDCLTVSKFGDSFFPKTAPFLPNSPPSLPKLALLKAKYMPDRPSIKFMLSQYPRLEELTWELQSEIDLTWQPSNVNKAFRPLHSNLVKLEMSISMTGASEFYNRGGGQMDFSNFTSLKFLKIYNRIIFAHKDWEDPPPDCYRNCYERLPASLVEFEVTFDSCTCAIRPGGKEGVDYSWLINLANQKSNNLKHLSKVTMLEAGDLTDEEDKNLHSYLSVEKMSLLSKIHKYILESGTTRRR